MISDPNLLAWLTKKQETRDKRAGFLEGLARLRLLPEQELVVGDVLHVPLRIHTEFHVLPGPSSFRRCFLKKGFWSIIFQRAVLLT